MYKVYFIDGSIEEYSLTPLEWSKLPNKPIQKVECNLPKKTIIMEGYEAYNCAVEKHFKHTQGIESKHLWLMVKKDTDTMIIKFDLRTAKIDYDAVDFGKEWHGKPVTGWKPGIKNGKPRTNIY